MRITRHDVLYVCGQTIGFAAVFTFAILYITLWSLK